MLNKGNGRNLKQILSIHLPEIGSISLTPDNEISYIPKSPL